jgi:hypothetical protein
MKHKESNASRDRAMTLKGGQLEMYQRAFIAQEGKTAFDGFAEEAER